MGDQFGPHQGTEWAEPAEPVCVLESMSALDEATVPQHRSSHVRVDPVPLGKPSEGDGADPYLGLPDSSVLKGYSCAVEHQPSPCAQQFLNGGWRGPFPVVPTFRDVVEIVIATHNAPAVGSTAAGVNVADLQPATVAQADDVTAMIQGLLHGRVYWYGDFRFDMWFWIKQHHAILGIFLCHKMNPYSRCERFAVWLCCGCASFALGLLLLRSTGEKRTGASVVSVLNGGILAVLHMIMVMLATCPCVQAGSKLHADRYRSCCEKCGCFIMAYVWCKIALLLGVCVYFALWADVPIDHAFQVWAQSQLVAFASGIVSCAATFILKWYGLKGAFARLLPGQGGSDGARPKAAYPFGHTLPTDPQLLSGGDHCACCLRQVKLAM